MKKSLSVLLLSLSVVFVGCGKERTKVVSSVTVETSLDENENQIATVDFELDLGSRSLPFAHYELPDNYGMVALSMQDGKSHMALSVNLTAAAQLPSGDGTLPNGTPVPVDTWGTGVIEIPITQINGKVYVGFINGKVVLGLAVAIKELDGIGNEIGNANLFQTFNIKDYALTAGIFSSTKSGESGVGAFVGGGALWGVDFAQQFGYHAASEVPMDRVFWSYRLKRRGQRRAEDFIMRLKEKNTKIYPVLR